MLTLLTIVCTVGMAQDETVWKSLSFPDDYKSNNKCNNYATTWIAKIGDDSWSVSNFNNNTWNNSWTYIKCGSKKNASVAAIVNDVAYTEAVTKVVVKIKTASSLDKVNSVRLIVASDKECNNVVETIDGSFGSNSTFTGDLTFNVTKPAKNLFYKFVIDIKKATNGIISISGVDYYISNSETSTPPTTTTFGAYSGKTFTFTNGTLEGFTAPTATATKSDDNTDLSNLIEYTSSDADIVAVDSKTGELTFTNTKFGKAAIIATLPKTDTYKTSTDSYFVENKDNHIATSLSFNGTDVTLTEGKTDAGADFTGYTATEANNIAGTITYAASGDAVATVNETTGAVTVTPSVYGTTTITATFTPADPTQYSGSTATYQITNQQKIDESTIVFDCSTYNQSLIGGAYDDNNNTPRQLKSVAGKDYTFTLTQCTFTNNSIQMKATKGKIVSPTFSSFPSGYKVVVTYTTNNTPQLYSAELTDAKAEVNKSLKTVSIELPSPTATFTIQSDTKYTQIKKIELSALIIKDNPALSFAEATVTKELVAGTIDLQALTKPEDLDASAITYTSSDDATAKVEGNTIRLYKTGEVTITATSAATDKYAAGTASYKLIISDSRKDAALAVKANPVKVKLGDDIYDLASNITCDNGLNSETFKYTSSDNSYTIVDNLIQISKIGTTTITAKFDGNDSYKPAEVSYTFEVEDPHTTDADFKFAAESYSADLAEATAGIVTFNAADVLQNPHSLNVTYTISPASANATIGETDGEALIEVSGTYTITATAAANDTYKETTATCTLNVTNGNETIITFIPQEDHGLGKDKDNNQGPDEMKKSFVTIASGNAWFNSDENAFCFYQAYQSWNNKTTISTTEGYITKIEFIGSSSKYSFKNLECDDTNFVAEDYYASWTGSAQSVTFTTTQQTHTTQIIVTVEVPKAKNYTLDETKTDNIIETYENANVTLQRTLSKDYWNTFCVPFALDAEQVAQYFGEGTQLRTYEGNCNNNIVYFATVDNIEAGKPYIMKPGNAVVQNPTFEGVSMVATGLDENGNPQAVGDASTVQMKGIYNQILLNTDKTELFLGDNDLFYYPIDDVDARTIGGLRAYFIVPQGTDIKKLRANLDGTPTSLDTIFDTEESNAPVYNLQGQCVGNTLRALKSGIYIQNGKKVVVK
ncbi:putative uncharacterized protein [Leyella stercorea CAG:629]|uniref:BIG2 domain-containing protein n=2 Tax=Leyella stercorea TaxID=363265 RepID=R7GT55_9BACT|nr:putative uncharacterized protein [Leyella stercorea CAG:629]